ncbi:NUDIX domain-containing protein [Planococcus sp. A6]|uniref:NUDIX hydrolase n=1 Tax=Planococcus sp. A6 TaxID=2992760 RepID=UPI00237B8E79|nr:NUDIX domain-containing protein [Planococcus sp. A6]MDE0581666.1 NUDIX domain-containing protein [Planococcus sp. A6]
MELWDLVDASRKPLNKLHTRGEELQSDEFHVVVEVYTINADGRMLMTQRDAAKTFPLLWESTGGSVHAGESSVEGAVRELAEETGIAVAAADLQYLGERSKGKSFLDSYLYISHRTIEINELTLQPGEVCDAKWVRVEELKEMNRTGQVVAPVWERYQLYSEELKSLFR